MWFPCVHWLLFTVGIIPVCVSSCFFPAARVPYYQVAAAAVVGVPHSLGEEALDWEVDIRHTVGVAASVDALVQLNPFQHPLQKC